MNPIDELRRALPTLTKSELKAAERILNDPNIMLGSSITNLAKLTGSSNSAIIRMCQKLGYDGFAEFRFSFNRAMMQLRAPLWKRITTIRIGSSTRMLDICI